MVQQDNKQTVDMLDRKHQVSGAGKDIMQKMGRCHAGVY
jgi:hypothetical protein